MYGSPASTAPPADPGFCCPRTILVVSTSLSAVGNTEVRDQDCLRNRIAEVGRRGVVASGPGPARTPTRIITCGTPSMRAVSRRNAREDSDSVRCVTEQVASPRACTRGARPIGLHRSAASRAACPSWSTGEVSRLGPPPLPTRRSRCREGTPAPSPPCAVPVGVRPEVFRPGASRARPTRKVPSGRPHRSDAHRRCDGTTLPVQVARVRRWHSGGHPRLGEHLQSALGPSPLLRSPHR